MEKTNTTSIRFKLNKKLSKLDHNTKICINPVFTIQILCCRVSCPNMYPIIIQCKNVIQHWHTMHRNNMKTKVFYIMNWKTFTTMLVIFIQWLLSWNLLKYVWCKLQCCWCVMVDANYEILLSFSLWNKSDEITSLLLILVLLNAVPSKQLLWSSLSVKRHSPHSSVNQFLLLIIDSNKRTSLCLWPWFPPLF